MSPMRTTRKPFLYLQVPSDGKIEGGRQAGRDFLGNFLAKCVFCGLTFLMPYCYKALVVAGRKRGHVLT